MRHQGPYCVDVAPGLQERRVARHRVHSIGIGAMLQEQTHDLLYLWLATDNQEIPRSRPEGVREWFGLSPVASNSLTGSTPPWRSRSVLTAYVNISLPARSL